MLRLRPSEITLTPADVEETRRRMSRRHAPVIPSVTSHPHRGPRLRPGPVRSRDDAIHRLGKIPVLTPHQVIHASADLETGSSRPQQANAESGSDARSAEQSQSEAESHVSSEQSTPSPVRGLQLPFRPALTAASGAVRLPARDNTDTGASSPQKHSPHAPSFSQSRTNFSGDYNEGAAQTQLHISTDGSAGDGPAPGDTTARLRSLRRRRGLASPGEVQDQAGYFVSPDWYTFRESYNMPHTEPRQRSGRFAPRGRTLSSTSDPSHSTAEPVLNRSRHLQPDDVFWTSTIAEPQVDDSQVATGIIEQPERAEQEQPEEERPRPSIEERIRSLHTRFQSTQGRMREFFERREAPERQAPEGAFTAVRAARDGRFSEASSSNSSQPYSYYELPPSRHSSLDHSQDAAQAPPAQFDGAGPSRPASRGAYYSIRPSQVSSLGETAGRPALSRVASFSSPNLTATLGQHGLSPRPANPYARFGAGPSTAGSSIPLISQDDMLGEERDASQAIERDLTSPLDLIAQRAYAQLTQVSSMVTVRQPPAAGPPAPPAPPLAGASPRAPGVFQYQVEEFDNEPRRRAPLVTGGIRQESGNAAHQRILNPARHAPDILGEEHMHHRHERSSTQGSDVPPFAPRMRSGRAGQRSSENAPVGGAATYGSRPDSRTQRVSFGHAPRPRTSQGVAMRGGGDFPLPQPHPALRHHPSARYLNRDSSFTHRSGSSSPVSPPRNFRRQSQRLGPHSSPSRLRRSMTNSGAGPSHSSDTERSHRFPLPLRHPVRSLEVPRFPHQQQLRASALLSGHRHADPTLLTSHGLVGRRPPIPARIASRRLPAQQRNQENSGDAEAELMRAEMEAASMRYGDDAVGLEVMDETPPRVGRFERRILESEN